MYSNKKNVVFFTGDPEDSPEHCKTRTTDLFVAVVVVLVGIVVVVVTVFLSFFEHPRYLVDHHVVPGGTRKYYYYYYYYCIARDRLRFAVTTAAIKIVPVEFDTRVVDGLSWSFLASRLPVCSLLLMPAGRHCTGTLTSL